MGLFLSHGPEGRLLHSSPASGRRQPSMSDPGAHEAKVPPLPLPPVRSNVVRYVRERIAEGTLAPGALAPSGAELARILGYSVLTCRKALSHLAAEGVLTRGPSPISRYRVAGPSPGRELSPAARALCAGLSDRRRAAGLTQPALADLIGHSLASVGHAETGRLWQSRDWWQLADKALDANGEVLRLYDAYRDSEAPAGEPQEPGPPEENEPVPIQETGIISTSDRHAVKSIVITWADGDVTAIRIPAKPAKRKPHGRV